jgi:hypothetical protein
MFSVDALRARLDTGFENSVNNYQHVAQNMDITSADDMHLFNQAQRDVAISSWAANQDVVLTHNLVKAIIDEMR